MPAFNAVISIPQNGTAADVSEVNVDFKRKRVSLSINVAGIGVRTIHLTGNDAKAFFNVQVTGVALKTAFQKAIRATIDQSYSVTSTPTTTVDDDFA